MILVLLWTILGINIVVAVFATIAFFRFRRLLNAIQWLAIFLYQSESNRQYVGSIMTPPEDIN